jgi:DNA-binding Lrp family transcriptional regulator
LSSAGLEIETTEPYNGPMPVNMSTSRPQDHAPHEQPVDDVDRAILRALRDDGRLSVSDLARQANVSRANAYARLDRLRTVGVIEGYQVRVNARAVGLDVAALIFLTVDQGRWRQVRDRLTEFPEVEFVGLTAGDSDFVVLVRTTSTDTLRDVVLERFMTMPQVHNCRTVILLDDFGRAPVIP